MSDFLIAQIRTYTPILAGVVISWLVTQGILDEETSQSMVINLTAVLTGLFAGGYYLVVRLLAEWKPGFGILLGVNKAPDYTK